jgi:CheY-like chemotaxis protein
MVVALVEDLLFRSKIREVARRAGVDVLFPRTATEAATTARALKPSLAVVDLHAEKLDPLGSLAALRAEGIPAIGFFAHVQTDLARAALEAGATEVMPRSAFAARLPEILTGGRTEAMENTGRDKHGDTGITE